MYTTVAIVGGGLAGLHAARLLHAGGVDFQLFEARNRLGGRILSADERGLPSTDGFDLGPSWFWPGMQPAMGELVEKLGLSWFAQNSEGDVIFQRMSREPPQRYRGMRQEPQSMRLAGGTGAIISALASDLPEDSVRLSTRVTRVALAGSAVEIGLVDASGLEERVQAVHVILALPPRLLESTISFSPELDLQTAQRWRDTPTWMAPHAKFFALYDRAFWRENGLSGTAQSMVGPLVEIHDATTASGMAALFGFVGVPGNQRAALGRETIMAACVTQLSQLFGPDAGTPRATLFKDWAADPLTSTEDDLVASGHPVASIEPWTGDEWRDYISLAGSETSRTEPGYLAGAVEAAERVIADIISRLDTWTDTPSPKQLEETRR